MTSLESANLSNNILSGTIPKSLEELRYLKNFNVSFNRLEREIPKKGPFLNFTSQSFMGNKVMRSKLLLIIFVPLGASVMVVGSTIVFVLRRRYDQCNLLGSGGFGSVYEGVFANGMALAIKVFNLQVEGALKSFDAECEALHNLRHRNLTKVISCCSNLDFKAVLLEYMPDGSLDIWLHSDGYFLDIIQRLDIMIHVASALEYLHHGYVTVVVHSDLKPSNVLLDEKLVGYVSDFGLTKLIGEGESIAHTKALATMGYIAPEYGTIGLVSRRCGMYSYGAILMVTFTRKRPYDEMFQENLNMRSWVCNSLPDSPDDIIDDTLLELEDIAFEEKLRCVSSILELSSNCTAESPGEHQEDQA
ncbi:unnamed protein product [Withania somnifera]